MPATAGIAVVAAVAAATARGVRLSRVELGLELELATAWPHWQLQAAQAYDECIILCSLCVCGFELELGHSRPSGPAPEHLPPLCTPAATAAAHSGARRIASLNLSYFFVRVPLPLLIGLPCPRSEENCACRGIAVGAAVAAATARGVGSSRVELGLELELATAQLHAQPHWQLQAAQAE